MHGKERTRESKEKKRGESLKSITKPDRRFNQIKLESAAVQKRKTRHAQRDPRPYTPIPCQNSRDASVLPEISPATYSIVDSDCGVGVGEGRLQNLFKRNQTFWLVITLNPKPQANGEASLSP